MQFSSRSEHLLGEECIFP